MAYGRYRDKVVRRRAPARKAQRKAIKRRGSALRRAGRVGRSAVRRPARRAPTRAARVASVVKRLERVANNHGRATSGSRRWERTAGDKYHGRPSQPVAAGEDVSLHHLNPNTLLFIDSVKRPFEGLPARRRPDDYTGETIVSEVLSTHDVAVMDGDILLLVNGGYTDFYLIRANLPAQEPAYQVDGYGAGDTLNFGRRLQEMVIGKADVSFNRYAVQLSTTYDQRVNGAGVMIKSGAAAADKYGNFDASALVNFWPNFVTAIKAYPSFDSAKYETFTQVFGLEGFFVLNGYDAVLAWVFQATPANAQIAVHSCLKTAMAQSIDPQTHQHGQPHKIEITKGLQMKTVIAPEENGWTGDDGHANVLIPDNTSSLAVGQFVNIATPPKTDDFDPADYAAFSWTQHRINKSTVIKLAVSNDRALILNWSGYPISEGADLLKLREAPYFRHDVVAAQCTSFRNGVESQRMTVDTRRLVEAQPNAYVDPQNTGIAEYDPYFVNRYRKDVGAPFASAGSFKSVFKSIGKHLTKAVKWGIDNKDTVMAVGKTAAQMI